MPATDSIYTIKNTITTFYFAIFAFKLKLSFSITFCAFMMLFSQFLFLLTFYHNNLPTYVFFFIF